MSATGFWLRKRPAIVISDGNGTTTVDHGIHSRIELVKEGDTAKIVRTRLGQTFILKTGTTVEMTRLYREMGRDLRNGGSVFERYATGVLCYALGAAILANACYIMDRYDRHVPAEKARIAREKGTLAGQAQFALPPETAVAPIPQAIPAALPPIAAKPDEAIRQFGVGTQVLPRPDFLRLPGEAPTRPAVTPAAPPSPIPVPAKPEARPMPQANAAPAVPAQVAAAPVAAPAAAATAKAPETTPAPVVTATATPVAPTPAPSPVTTAQPVAPVEKAKPVETANAAAPAAANPAPTKVAAAPVDIDKHAIGKLVKDMTPEQAMAVMNQINKLDDAGGEITEDMLTGLPHEVANMLKAAGLVTPSAASNDADAPGGTPYRIIRIPEKMMATHRGKDGIANIPESNSWAATGNFVRLPLPGGGDIKTPEDLKSFNLKP